MMKFLTTLFCLFVATSCFAQSPCSQLNASMTISQNGHIVTVTNNANYPSNVTPSTSVIWGDSHSNFFASSSPTISHSYYVNGTFTIMMIEKWSDTTVPFYCRDTAFATVTIANAPPPPPLPNVIEGTINYNTSKFPVPLSFDVFLLQRTYNPVKKIDSLYVVDSVTSNMSMGASYYSFVNKPTGAYFLKASVSKNLQNPGLMPTYYNDSSFSTVHWDYAKYFFHDSNKPSAITCDMQYQKIFNGVGVGSISGNISEYSGASIPDQLILLRAYKTTSSLIVDFTFTDVNGNYSFNNLSSDTFIVYPAVMNYTTVASSDLIVGYGVNSYVNVDFERNYPLIQPKTTSVKDVVNNMFSIYPNPTKGQVNISWKEAIKGDAQIMITDIAGRVVYSTQAAASTTTQINLSNLNQGVYFVKINTAKGQYTEKIVLL